MTVSQHHLKHILETAVHIQHALPKPEQLTLAGKIGQITAAIHRLSGNHPTNYSLPN